jgi:leucyl aminopeptidase
MQILPPDTTIALRTSAARLSEAGLARCDAALIVVDASVAEESLEGLPHARLWRDLFRGVRRRPKATVLASRVPNARHTLVAIGIARPEASAFERLELARKLAHEALVPGVRALHCHAVGFAPAVTAGVVESLVSAVLAAAAPMPESKSKPTPPCDLRTLVAHGMKPADLAVSRDIALGNHLARWLAVLPPNELDCVTYRRALRTLARREGWSFRFYDERSLARLGAGAFLAVARANDHRGAGIVRLGYRPRVRRRGAVRVGLVGKGICFDTGGINLKSQKGMYHMHGDMQGSAVALGALLSLARSGAPFEIDCWLALTENEIGPRAYRPQEVVRASNGVTIQVVHSDAEGRMVLADTLALASRTKPGLLLDFATLTGACVNALTERYSGAFTNRPDFHETLQTTGQRSGERVWCFPMDADFDEELDSRVADVMQCTNDGKGDHILAARFLGRFVDADVPWIHVDLSSSERKDGLAHVPTEFTGFGVRFATHLLRDAQFVERLGRR